MQFQLVQFAFVDVPVHEGEHSWHTPRKCIGLWKQINVLTLRDIRT